jgi:uncharacterized protein (TIGR00369 family)
MSHTIDPQTMTGLELLTFIADNPETFTGIGALLGMRAAEVSHGRVVFAVEPQPAFANPLGVVHGGICATLLDSAMGCAIHSTLEAGVGFSTLELSVNYIRSVPTDGGRLTATGTTIHVGRTTATAEGRVIDEQGRLVAHGTTTCIIQR